MRPWTHTEILTIYELIFAWIQWINTLLFPRETQYLLNCLLIVSLPESGTRTNRQDDRVYDFTHRFWFSASQGSRVIILCLHALQIYLILYFKSFLQLVRNLSDFLPVLHFVPIWSTVPFKKIRTVWKQWTTTSMVFTMLNRLHNEIRAIVEEDSLFIL